MTNKTFNPRVLQRWTAPHGAYRTVRNIFREHLAFNRATIKRDLANALGISPVGAAALMTKTFPVSPAHIERFIAAFKLDEFDALELRLQGAIEQGWQLEPLKKNARI